MNIPGEDSLVHIVAERPSRSAQFVAIVERCGGQAQTHQRLDDFLAHDVRRMHGCLVVDVTIQSARDLSMLWRAQPALPVIVVSSIDDVETAVDAMRNGAFHCFEAPLIEAEEFGLTLAAAIRCGAERWRDVQRHTEL